MKLFKYLDDKHVENFIEKGQLLFRSLSYYQNAEDSKIKDEYDGKYKYKPKNGLEIRNVKTGELIPSSYNTFNSAVKTDEIFILCLSTTLSENLYSKFERDTCIEITDTLKFSKKIQTALTRKRLPPFHEGKITYYTETDLPQNIWPRPDKIVFSKLHSFKPENEYRFAFSYTNAFDFENVDISLTQGEQQKSRRRYPEKLITIKNISDICKIHKSTRTEFPC